MRDENESLSYEDVMIKLNSLKETTLTLNNDLHRIARRAFYTHKSLEEIEIELLKFESEDQET